MARKSRQHRSALIESASPRLTRHARFRDDGGEVVHVIAKKLIDLSPLLGSLGQLGSAFPLPHGRGDGARGGGGPDPRDNSGRQPAPRDILVPDLHIDNVRTPPLVKSRDFH